DPAATNPCPGDGVCGQSLFFLQSGAGQCFDACTVDGDCRTGYSCQNTGLATNVCMPSNASCGDGIITFPETCDGNNITFTCQNFGFATGSLACDGACNLQIGTCADTCGDGVIGPTEECEGTNVGTLT